MGKAAPFSTLLARKFKNKLFLDTGMSKIKRDNNFGYLNFFDIELSGLYSIQRRSSKDIFSESHGLSTREVFRGIKTWVAGRQFKETSPWASIGKTGDDPVMCYCREIKELDNGDFMLVLWKHDPSDTRGFRGLELGSDGRPTGNYINNSASATGDNVVWGHPCYYWILSNESVVVSIKFEDSKCDTDLMKKWVSHCVRYRIKFDGFNSRQPGESDTKIFFSTPSSPERFNLIYRFSVRLREFKTNEDTLMSICARTKHMLLRNEVVVSSVASAAEDEAVASKKKGLDKANVEIFDYFQNFIRKYFVGGAQEDREETRRVEVKIEATPSIEQLKELMEYSSDFPEDGWPDVIFIDENDIRTSIKKHRIVENIVLPVGLDAYSCDSLYAAVKDYRARYLSFFKQDVFGGKHEKSGAVSLLEEG